jgi:hypothetical protein
MKCSLLMKDKSDINAATQDEIAKFGGDDRDFLKEGVRSYRLAKMLSFNTPTSNSSPKSFFFFSLTFILHGFHYQVIAIFHDKRGWKYTV